MAQTCVHFCPWAVLPRRIVELLSKDEELMYEGDYEHMWQ